MKKLLAYSVVLMGTAAGALAATDMLVPEEPTVIEIEVDAVDLERCRETLAQVAMTPAVADNGSRLLFAADESLPTVTCVVKNT
ncbi:hypothetical protein [Tropicibacter naphthalenivorans]|uniref:Uncharacterized protein n=1 Tax=Tropicibacter naphthalenivorans TaxID=441103 RepID=A0A0P1G859_9RHOB|nr:hypothetical protein [Tropicibacter naphthalenivorans]CUH77848.1 hypothetical protein TRN7648_01650 [Tropicibacter naphthalenivorans]SMC95745.1 hypothetical protein SAMN04488093_107191 [Tropicibacter naphthalenivorans]